VSILFLQIAASSSRKAVSFSATHISARSLQGQTHRELVNRPVHFQKRGQLFIRVHNEPLSVAAVRVSNPDCSPLSESMAETLPQLQPALLRLSATISQYRFTLAGHNVLSADSLESICE
jgi:hypothetical protein